MATLHSKIKEYLGRDFETIGVIPDVEVKITNDGTGDKITYWSDSIEKSQPTEEQLNSLDAQAITSESNKQVDSTRRKEYGSWNDQLDEIYHDMDAWKARLQTIKTNNPKS
jgi:hypothetical protein